MELLRFDSRAPAERFVPLIDQLKRKFKSVAMISPSARYTWEALSHDFPSEQIGVPQLVPLYS
jgi:hypothetical protein